MENLLYFIPLLGICALLFILIKYKWIQAQDTGTDRMKQIGEHISQGARAFLRAEYTIIAIFVAIVAVLIAIKGGNETESHSLIALSFVVGACCSGLAGFIGMSSATKSNVRTTQAARTSLSKALKIAFTGGSVMGLGVVGLGVIGLSSLFIFYHTSFDWGIAKTLNVLAGFSLGASSIAFFSRVGGGIYTKAADVGADLVGKVEAGIPEDHPLNPATIADNVGDNVGDVAGMGADLFESYVGSILATMVLGIAFIDLEAFNAFPFSGILLPLVLAGIGIFVSIFGTFLVKGGKNPQRSLNLAEVISSLLMIVVFYFVITWLLPESWALPGMSPGEKYTSLGVFWATVSGLLAGLAIGGATEFYTGTGSLPVKNIAKQSLTGPATNIISGIGTGMFSTAAPVIFIGTAILISHHFAGLYGIAIAAVGMLANMGIQLAVDAYGPISDNAGGIAEMSGMPKEVRERTDKLDAVGNTTAAIGKGFAIGSAALTALALFAAYIQQTGISAIDISKPTIIVGLMLGTMIPFIFSALSMQAVGKAAMAMINEVRRQFSSIPALKSALSIMKKYDSDLSKASKEEVEIITKAYKKAGYTKCVAISTKASIREMVLPGILAILMPVVTGFLGGAEMLGGLLAGVTMSGVLLAIFQSNAGGAWDNAKKMFEEGIVIDGKKYTKGSDPHKAAVVGDTVGDPFKDTSGPSLNILLKLMSIVALVIAPSLTSGSMFSEKETKQKIEQTEVRINVDANNKEMTSYL